MDVRDLTDSQLNGFSIVERVCSVFSLLGCILVIGTFCASKSFHKPINRLVFYASFGNLMTNVATLMARTYIADALSPGCQFQAFLIQMFMPADAFWTLAMAVNVYLTFYYKFDAQKLRKMEIPYLIICYGVPFIVALTYVFVNDAERGRVYGNATLWCWVSNNWDVWRIGTFYGPVWVIILITFFIYIRAGHEIYRKHKQLRDFCYSTNQDNETTIDDTFSKTTEVFVTTEIVNTQQPPAIDLAPLGRRGSTQPGVNNSGGLARGASTKAVPAIQSPAISSTSSPSPANAVYSVTISSNAAPDSSVSNGLASSSTPGNNKSDPGYRQSANDNDLILPIQSNTDNGQSLSMIATNTSTNPTDAVFPGTTGTATATAGPRNPANPRNRRRAVYEANSAAWSYTKCAILFFTALLVTWIPSSANRVFSVVHVGDVSVPLEYMSAFVLPLQGFWNAIIYVTTSWKACKMLWDDVVLSNLEWGRRRLQARHEQQQASQYHHGLHLHHFTVHGTRGGGGGRPPPQLSSQRDSVVMDGGGGRSAQVGRNTVRVKSSSSSSSMGSLETVGQVMGGNSRSHSARSPKMEKSYESESIQELAR